MQLIPVCQGPRTSSFAHADERAVEAMAGVIGCVGSPTFANEALAQINRWLPVSWWSVFCFSEGAPPHMPASGSYGMPDGTAESWKVYRAHLYREDQTFVAASEKVVDSSKLLVHWHAREIPRAHREQIYTRHGLRERLSVVSRDPQAGLMAINLYRHDDLPVFTEEEIDWVGSGASLLSSCVLRHLELARPAGSAPAQLLAGLPRREREVCERLLKGWTYDGIGADLGVSPGTVKTYRDRAFDRLGIHHRNELFALALDSRSH